MTWGSGQGEGRGLPEWLSRSRSCVWDSSEQEMLRAGVDFTSKTRSRIREVTETHAWSKARDLPGSASLVEAKATPQDKKLA